MSRLRHQQEGYIPMVEMKPGTFIIADPHVVPSERLPVTVLLRIRHRSSRDGFRWRANVCAIGVLEEIGQALHARNGAARGGGAG
jgi:hypothetical protein